MFHLDVQRNLLFSPLRAVTAFGFREKLLAARAVFVRAVPSNRNLVKNEPLHQVLKFTYSPLQTLV